ncbi:MAG: dihydrodipicolinate reductase [Pseudomonadota bacterium]
MIRSSFAAIAMLFSTSAGAEPWAMVSDASSFQPVTERDQFVEIVTQGTLSRFGIKLNVLPDGRIDGRAFGRDVSGAWDWRDGYFCRDLSWGAREIGANCQEVKISGTTLRFTSDEGTGRYADLRLR